ncbi:MAG TPA: phosphate acyltransferase, partial [Casimicrobiaceae bacterium]|nr:phosphate acyltransferase [Casimicrobiaceae bacterium]
DYPNQVNNVLCFPFIFRGALDVGATTINEQMKLACMRAIADLAHAELSDVVAQAYAGESLSFGPEYLIPKPFDPRLMFTVPPAVARAAMESGVSTRPIADFDAYRERLSQFIYHSGLIMRPVFAMAKNAPKRVVFAEGEEERVLRAVQVVVDEGLARPTLIGRPEVIAARVEKFGLRLVAGKDFELVNINSDPRYKASWQLYYQLMGRNGISPEDAKEAVLRKPSLIGTLLLQMGECDALLCGTVGKYNAHLRHVADVIGRRPDAPVFAAMNGLMLPNRTLFICDTYVNRNPTAEQLVEITRLAAEGVRRFGLVPKVALLSHSNFGSDDSKSACKMREARRLLGEREPALEMDGEMHGDAALSGAIRGRVHPDSTLNGEANLLVMPNLDAANISFNLLKITGGDGLTIGPILLGARKPVLIATPSATVRRLVNLTALAVVSATAGDE